MRNISAAGNTVVPAIVALEDLGFIVSVGRTNEGEQFRATRGDETYEAEDPMTVLGLVKLVEVRGWDWRSTDPDVERVMRQYRLGE